MRSVVISTALCALTWIGAGCGSSEKFTGAVHRCPACQETVTWVYGSDQTQGRPPGTKLVTHTCYVCKAEWTAAIPSTSVCAECNATAEKCPACVGRGIQD